MNTQALSNVKSTSIWLAQRGDRRRLIMASEGWDGERAVGTSHSSIESLMRHRHSRLPMRLQCCGSADSIRAFPC